MYMQFAGTNIPLSKQVRNFGVTRAQMVTTLGSTTANHLLSKSLFLLAIGTNDMAAFAITHQQQHSDVAAFYSILISNYSAAITVCNDTLIFHTGRPHFLLRYVADRFI